MPYTVACFCSRAPRRMCVRARACVRVCSQEMGQLSVADLALQYGLATDLILKTLQQHMGSVVQVHTYTTHIQHTTHRHTYTVGDTKSLNLPHTK